jgi:N-acetylmuramoyl-L-alanine amidase
MRWVGIQCAKIKADCAVELHFNSAGPFAEGHEWLYWSRSTLGKVLAEAFDFCFRKRFPERVARGVKPLGLDNRGALFLRLTPCPAAILEPFFGSNKNETEFFGANQKALAETYADAIDAFFAKRDKPKLKVDK